MKIVIKETGELREPSARVRVNGQDGPDALDYLYLDFWRKGDELEQDDDGNWVMTRVDWEDLLDTFRFDPHYWNMLVRSFYGLYPGMKDVGNVNVRLVFREGRA